MDSVINKPGGTAAVIAIEQIPTGWRYHLESDKGVIGAIDVPQQLADVELGDEFDYEGEDFTKPTRISFGGLVLFETPPAPVV
jgi:hypothetical protein